MDSRAPSAPLTPAERTTMPVVSGANGPRPKFVKVGKQVLNHASYNFMGLAGNETTKMREIETLRKYGVGRCGPPGFYGTIGAPAFLSTLLLVMIFFVLQTSTWTLSAT